MFKFSLEAFSANINKENEYSLKIYNDLKTAYIKSLKLFPKDVNLIGVYFTQKNQKPDHHYLADDILLMLHRLRDPDPDCEKNDIKCHIREAVKGLKEAINEAESSGSESIEGDSDSELQSLIRF